MAAVSSSYRRAGGFTLALQILGIIDLLLSLGVLAIAISSVALRPQLHAQALLMTTGAAALVLMLQMPLRLALLVVRALWTPRLVCNAVLFQRLPVTPQWAWAGFVTPVVSLWLPARMIMALADGGRPGRVLQPLCLAWAILRWLTCPSGWVAVFAAVTAFAVYREVMAHRRWDGSELGLALELVLAIAGTGGAALGVIVTTWVARRQARPDQLHHAEVF